jgi:hypothetical protein
MDNAEAAVGAMRACPGPIRWKRNSCIRLMLKKPRSIKKQKAGSVMTLPFVA